MQKFLVGLFVVLYCSSAIGQDKFTKDVIKYVNIERVVAGLNPVEYNEPLNNAAQYWTEFLGDINDFTHFVQLEDYPTYPLVDMNSDGYCNIDDRTLFFGFLGSTSENIAIQKSMKPQDVVWAWMNSPGHRSNILNPNWTHAGVGKGPWNAGRNICVMNFGAN